MVFDRLVIEIAHVDVIHDCDPAWDNPGDFQGWVEIYQAMNPVQGEVNFQLLGSSPRRTLLLNSGESVSGTDIRAEGLVARVRSRTVSVQGNVRELDNGVLDAVTGITTPLRWWDEHNCWQLATGQCMATTGASEFHHTWIQSVHTRDDVWNPFNSDDEGCAFAVTFRARISEL